MKIEKINDNQIKCTLTAEDLASRHLKLSELAYGTEKIQDLFREMIQQAGYECGFDAADIPLMIEAIPMSSGCVVLIITKVEDPEELDTRFSRFSPTMQALSEEEHESQDMDSDAELFRKPAKEIEIAAAPEDLPFPAKGQAEPTDLIYVLQFKALQNVLSFVQKAQSFLGESSLYKDSSEGNYLLVLRQAGIPLANFRKICSLASEFGHSYRLSSASDSYLSERCEVLIASDAVHKLA